MHVVGLNINFIFVFLIVLTISSSLSEEIDPFTNESDAVTEIAKHIEDIEKLSKAAAKANDGVQIPIQDTNIIYEGIIQVIQTIIESFKDKIYANEFLKSRGIERVIVPNLMMPHSELKTSILVLVKILFEVTPTATKAAVPIALVDRLLDIFENDENLALKAHSVDILALWLPKNPLLQARVMKLKGLEPFYNQITKLNGSIVKTLLELFNVILKEHIRARDGKIQKGKNDKSRLYQRIGLIERMSTPPVCIGLVHAIDIIWNYNIKDDNNSILNLLLELTNNLRQFCLKVLRGKTKAIEIYDLLFKFVTDPGNEDLFLKSDINVTATRVVLGGFLKDLKIRDEL
ncbi:uncharacterized protein LOC114252944 [Bombyx mandarina]|uniref:Uncharacterized protein LOC114252944 n=1 Tax=Bombyx mandarina TaxID=7092 RepID=A0A6J2KR54_BOMMA|nr:uncharacterized protein LOC114252944 [Bombyx mandarina]